MRIILTLLVLASFAPLPAQAYLTPEEVLEEEDFVAPPPNARGAKAARAAQEAEYEARMAADEGITTEEETEEDDGWTPGGDTIDDLHGSADEEEVIDWDTDDASAEERHAARVLDRVERTRLDNMARGEEVILHGSAPGEQEQLHGGAPLAPTGMGTIAAVLTVALAVGITLRAALKS